MFWRILDTSSCTFRERQRLPTFISKVQTCRKKNNFKQNHKHEHVLSMLYFTLLLRVWSCVNLLFAEQSFSSTSLAHNSIQATSSSVSAKRMVCCRSTYVRLRAYLSKHFTNGKPWHHVSCSPLIIQWLYANDSISKIQSWPAWKRTICTIYCMYICIISIDHVFIITGIGRKRPAKRTESLFMFLPYAWLWVGPRDGTQILRQAPISPEF